MTVASLLFVASLSAVQKQPEMRAVDVKAAGLSVSVPKAWAALKKDSMYLASFKIPIANSKNSGRIDIGSVDSDNRDVEGFLEASKSVLMNGGNTVERQWKVDIMDSPLALTRYTRAGMTTVRGVLFRPAKTKLVLSISSNNEDFASVEPVLMSTLETLKVIRVVEPKVKNAVPEEKKLELSPRPGRAAQQLPVAFPVTLGAKRAFFHFPAGTKTKKVGEDGVAATIPGTEITVNLVAYSSDASTPSLIYQTKAADTANLFKGSIYRLDQSSNNNADKQNRDFIWRTGVDAKSGAPLFSCDVVITQAAPIFVYGSFRTNEENASKKYQKAIANFLLAMNLTDKP